MVRTVGVSSRIAATVASCQPSVRAAEAPSVTVVPLFEPLVAAVVVAEGLPEPGLVPIRDPQAADPLGALPEVARRDHEAGRPAVLRCEGAPVVLPRDEGLVVEHVREREV